MMWHGCPDGCVCHEMLSPWSSLVEGDEGSFTPIGPIVKKTWLLYVKSRLVNFF